MADVVWDVPRLEMRVMNEAGQVLVKVTDRNQSFIAKLELEKISSRMTAVN
jgi:hypothetical protein